ncbi:cytochrome c oxidase assembly protein [Roseicyclus mahoneyensis]|uniref:Putative membrane protein n=1 Tax=Roseicyclus mahoneyensis TaxID=164332 RepID=A0A316GK78_9RHOB|nr:cytochrome c oxidase assembly protein [Roseicyclus mahoneyensis]PWK61455.1 putative membrane protein [Roseicyclus mahoneyensis]
MSAPATAYCGTPAIPAEVWTSWNLDPVVMAGLVGLTVTCRMRSSGTAQHAGFAAVAVLAVIFLSPLCALSAALFSVRVVHHVLLIAVAAPLLVLAFPARYALPLSALVAVNLIVLWLWHVPGVYTWAIGSVAGYWLMQASLLGTALALWREVLRRGSDPGAGIAALLAMVAQMGLLGALIAFAPRALYPTHGYTTEVWGFSPLEDQQLAGLIMWVPAILPYLAAALVLGMGRLFPPEPAR